VEGSCGHGKEPWKFLSSCTTSGISISVPLPGVSQSEEVERALQSAGSIYLPGFHFNPEDRGSKFLRRSMHFKRKNRDTVLLNR
jgi:DNA-binding transcriptional MocR family regulator